MPKILILDDNNTRMDDFIKAFQGRGCSISFCRTALEAMRRFPNGAPYDLMLLSQSLQDDPDGGEEFADFIPKAPKGLIPKIVIHAGAQDGIGRMCKGLGSKGYSVSWLKFGIGLILFLEGWAKDREVMTP